MQLDGMKAIASYVNRSETTTLELIRDFDLPARKFKGIWVSDTDSIDEWRREKLQGKPADPPKKAKKTKTAK